MIEYLFLWGAYCVLFSSAFVFQSVKNFKVGEP